MMLPNLRLGRGGGSGVSNARMTCATANTPTSAGIGSMPPNRSVMPKGKRGTPPGFSIPTQETSRAITTPAHALGGEGGEREVLEGRERVRVLGGRGGEYQRRRGPRDAADGGEPHAGAERELG